MVDFKASEEYKLATKDFDADYDKGVKQIFYNIWRKTCGVCYKFLGKEYRKHIAIWEDQEQASILDTRLPSYQEYSNDECEILGDYELDNSNTQDPPANAWSLHLYILYVFFYYVCMGLKVKTIATLSTFLANDNSMFIFRNFHYLVCLCVLSFRLTVQSNSIRFSSLFIL